MTAPMVLTQTPSSLIQASTKENRNHSILDFLQRVYLLDNFQWSKTQVVGTKLGQYRFPDVLFKQPAIARKTYNFFGFRAGVQFIVLVNKQQFQQGNLLISYLPGAKYNTAKNAMCQPSTTPGTEHFSTLTGMPRVNLDLMDATRADLTVPYASPFIFYNLLTGDGTIGDFYINVYAALKDVAASGTVSVQVMARFVDIELEFPSGSVQPSYSITPVLDSVCARFASKPNLTVLEELIRTAQQVKEDHTRGNFHFQMNRENISTSNFKPIALPNMTVSDNPNNSHIMSLSSQNSLPPANMGQASRNEMSFVDIVQIPVYFDRFDLSSSVAGNTNVYSKGVTLLNYDNVGSDESVGIDYITFLGQNFSKWRTSFKFNFRFVKTTFHSLRVRIFFAPNTANASGVDRNAIISKIIDLKDNNFVEFEVPFIWPHPFLNVSNGTTRLGVLGVDVLTRMVHPETVSDTIEVIVERSAGRDFCLNLPTQISYFPFDPTPITRKVSKIVPQQPKYEIVPEPKPLIEPEIIPKVYSDFVATLQNLSPNIRQYLLSNFSHFSNRNENLSLINSIASFQTVTPQNFSTFNHRTIFELKDMLHNFELRKREVSTEKFTDRRAPPETASSYVRDLTREGIESNPGPFESFSFINPNGTWTHPFISTLDGPMNISIMLGAPNFSVACIVDVTGDIVSTLAMAPFGISVYSFVYNGNKPSFTLTTTAGVPHQTTVSVVFTNDFPFLSLAIPDPLPVSVSNIPLPISTTGAGSAAVVATRSDQISASPFRFQMNHEQDSYRTGYDETSYVRPIISSQADLLSLGSPIDNVQQMIGRASLFSSFVPSNDYDIFVQPHFIGVSRKASDDTITISAADMYSYYASLYAFARGAVNLRIVSSPDFAYNVILDPDSGSLSTESAPLGGITTAITPLLKKKQQVSIQQVVKPALEGFGEIAVPFYSDTYMYYVNPVTTQQPKLTTAAMQLPYTTLDIRPLGQYTIFDVYRSACKDVEFSFLTGPPRVYALE